MRWSRVNALLDKEVQRETRKYLAKIKAVVSGGSHSNGTVEAKPRRGRKKSVWTKATRHRVLQGRYMGLVRALSTTQKVHVKNIRQASGIADAIKEAKRLRAAAWA